MRDGHVGCLFFSSMFKLQAEDAHKIRQENRRLQVEISLLTREIDVVNNGQSKYSDNFNIQFITDQNLNN